jgi:hypothetical protein
MSFCIIDKSGSNSRFYFVCNIDKNINFILRNSIKARSLTKKEEWHNLFLRDLHNLAGRTTLGCIKMKAKQTKIKIVATFMLLSVLISGKLTEFIRQL